MKIGYCTMNWSEKPLEEVCRMAADLGYDAVEIPAYTDNGQVDVDECLKNGNAKILNTDQSVINHRLITLYGLFNFFIRRMFSLVPLLFPSHIIIAWSQSLAI